MTEIYHKRLNNCVPKEDHEDTSDDSFGPVEQQIPLEMQQVVRAVKKYALQTSALGLGLGIIELENIIKMIERLASSDQQILKVLQFVESRHSVLKETFQRSYGM